MKDLPCRAGGDVLAAVRSQTWTTGTLRSVHALCTDFGVLFIVHIWWQPSHNVISRRDYRSGRSPAADCKE
jgi:hypothetical protein